MQGVFRPIPGLISCAGVARRWGLLSYVQNDQRDNISVKKVRSRCYTKSPRVGRAPFGHITGLTSCTGLASYQGPRVGELGTQCLCMCQVPLVTWIPLPPTRAWERDKVGVFCEVHHLTQNLVLVGSSKYLIQRTNAHNSQLLDYLATVKT